MRFFKDILYLFFPKICVVCDNNLLNSESILCTNCKHDLPIIDNNQFTINKITTYFTNRIPVSSVRSFLYYRKHGNVKKLIHNLKYKNQQEIGRYLGNWFANRLKEEKCFDDIDYIVPVPLHPKKLKTRGYNQLTLFGKELSSTLNIPYKPNILIRTSVTETQTFKKRFERFNNNKTKFLLGNTTIFSNKHVLLIDDVITTGATIEACCKELLKAPNITISVATLAFTEKT